MKSPYEFRNLLRATLPEGPEVVLYHWGDGNPEQEIVSEAMQGAEHNLPFEAYGKLWRITYCDEDYDEDDFVIEGVEWR